MLTSKHAWARSLAEHLQLKRPLIILDTETTGVNPKKDRVVQLGYIRIAVDGEIEEKEIDINPEEPIPSEAQSIHGISDARVATAPTFKDLAHDLSIILEGDVAGYNIRFDALVLYFEFQRCGIEWKPPCMIDAMKIYTMFYSRDLSSAVKTYLDETLANAHTALADARASGRVLESQLRRHKEELPSSVDELYELLFLKPPKGYADVDRKFRLTDDGQIIVNFGGHRDKKIEDVPRDYLSWMLKSDFSKGTKDVIIKWDKKRVADAEGGPN